MSDKITNTRIAFALLCGLALCCSIMYITADGEAVLADATTPASYGTSVDSKDVQKAAAIITNTPDGRMRLLDYFANVEAEITEEEQERKKDVAEVQAQMARNFAFNQQARAKLKKFLLAKMAANAKKAHADLEKAMRFVQGKFAEAAALQNKRNNANIARSAKLRATIEANKQAAKKNLETAVSAQQRAMSTLKASMNARITKTNAAVSANSAQIKENAKEAHKALEHAVAKFDKKVATAREEARKGRSKLAQQLENQDKAIKEWSNNKLKRVVAETASKFGRVRDKMAADREHADLMLKNAATKMTASLNAFTALNDKRFKQTVKDIELAKKEAKDRVEAAETEFKTHILRLRATVNHQVNKVNTRITQLSGQVEKNSLRQAKINANVEAEMKRMIKVGNERYAEHLKKDKELKSLIDKNKAATDARMAAMAAHYTQELDAVRATMKKNRAHASHMLAKESAKLYSSIAASEKQQLEENEKLAAQTRSAKLDIADELRGAKQDFADRLSALHATVVANDKKFEGKIDKLTGIVRADAVKNAKGRQEIRAVMDANKAELKKAVSDAIHQGETRMMAAENHLKDLNAKTKASLNMRITSQISKLTKRANSQIEGLRLSSAEARAEMRKELLYAVRSAADEAKENLADAVKMAKEAFTKAKQDEEAASNADKTARAGIASQIEFDKKQAKRSLKDAVGTMERTLLALKTETRKKIKKSNKKITAYGEALAKESTDVKAEIDANMKALVQKITDAQEAASKNIKGANAKSAAGFKSVLSTINVELQSAQKSADSKFAQTYTKMSENREHWENYLASSVKEINDSIAKQAALADSRFSKTVKKLAEAREQAASQVSSARKKFATGLATLTAAVKDQEHRISGDLYVVSGVHASNKAEQLKVNRRTNAELGRIMKLANDQVSKSSKARGKIRALLDENKRAAHEEVEALDQLFQQKLSKIRADAGAISVEAARDLSDATEAMYGKLASVQLKAAYENKLSAAKIAAFEKDAAGAIAESEETFDTRLNKLSNIVIANADKVEKQFEVLTGVAHDFQQAGEEDRELLNAQIEAFNADMQKRLVKAIMKGESDAKRVADRASQNLRGMKKSMLIEISERVEETADKLFESIQKGHQKLADNYLSLKAYAVTAKDKLTDYVTKGKGKNLSSLGDLLNTIANLAHIPVKAAEGAGFGSDHIRHVFNNKPIVVDPSLTKINGLTNEYVKATNDVRLRWPMGLGKYLLGKLEESMMRKGVLQVDKITSKAGNWVFLNGHAVGLSNKLNDFEGLAVRMSHYETTLAKLTASLSAKPKVPTNKKPFTVDPPEWEGN